MTGLRPDRILKILTPNDVGATHSHQAGWTIQKGIIDFFPALDVAKVNPDTWLLAIGPGGQTWSWRYIYYNTRIHGLGTRNEYRLTHVLEAMRDLGAMAGDLVEFTRRKEGDIHVRIVTEADLRKEAPRLVIDLSGPARWFIGDLPVR